MPDPADLPALDPHELEFLTEMMRAAWVTVPPDQELLDAARPAAIAACRRIAERATWGRRETGEV